MLTRERGRQGREGKCKPGSNEVSRQEGYMLAVTLSRRESRHGTLSRRVMVCVCPCVCACGWRERRSTGANLIYIVTDKMTSAMMKSNFWAIQR